MIQLALMSDIVVDLSVTLIAIVTLSTALVVGLAVYARPSPATITWGLAFGIGMIATYLWSAARQIDAPVLQAVASALMICFEPLIWAGLRLYAGRRPRWGIIVAFTVLIPTAMGLGATTASFPLVFRICFLTSAVFAGLVAYELIRLRSVAKDVVLPLLLMSCAYVIVAVAGFVGGILGTAPGDAQEQLSLLRDLNGIGTQLTSVSAAVTVILLARVRGESATGGEYAPIRAHARLRRAEAQHDAAWSLLDIRLDDPQDLRQAWSASTYARIVETFHDRICASLPAVADAERVSEGRTIALIPGGEESVQHHLRQLLASISTIDDDGPLAGIRFSASVGWAGADAVGFDYDDLAEAAAVGAVQASEDGGDRWQRAGR